jgi:hypothetical protein
MVTETALLSFLFIQLALLPFQLVLFYGIVQGKRRLKRERVRLVHQVRISQGLGGKRRWQ